jgi:predicted deacylase
VRRTYLICLILILALALPAIEIGAAETAQSFGPLQPRPGEVVSGFLPVPEIDGVGTAIPVTVIRGAKPGKTLALVAAVHGYEYPPVLALYRLKEMIDPARLSGTLVLVHIANLPSFQERTIYYTPTDGKNLNRVFPGDPKGTLSQRIAHVLTEEVVKKCDALVDMHCGDGNEALMQYTYWMISPDEKLNALSKEMALAFGLRHIIIDDTRGPDPKDSKYLGNTAVTRGIPAITTEAGMLGRVDENSIAKNVDGSLNVMKLLGMIEGEPKGAADPVWIDKYEVVSSNFDGLFYPMVDLSVMVEADQTVGVVMDYFGTVKEYLKAPFTGIILYIINTPPANKGEPLFEVGRIKK